MTTGDFNDAALQDRSTVIALMQGCTNEAEWLKNEEAVKQAHDGKHPSFWYHEIIQSGVAKEAAKKFALEMD